jgi:hypothetical protein
VNACDAVGEIDREFAIRKNIASDKHIMWRVQGGHSHDIQIDVGRWQEQSDVEIRGFDRRQASLIKSAKINRLEAEFFGKAFTDACAARPGVDLGENPRSHRTLNKGRGGNFDGEGWPILEKVIDRLSVSDLGPAGFFIICHRDDSCATPGNA